MPIDSQSGVYFEVHGSGIPLLFGFPLMASQMQVFGPEGEAMRAALLDDLKDRYSVLFIDYPGIGRSADIPPQALTAERVCEDILAVVDAAGFSRFAYVGYSWGGAVGLQLAWRTKRLMALAVGGWTPIGGQYKDMLSASLAQAYDPPEDVQVVLRSPDQYRQWSTFYASIQDWPESDALKVHCPSLVFAGSKGDVAAGDEWIRIASTLRENTGTLQAAGWQVHLAPDRDHASTLDPSILLPVLRPFLDEACGYGR